MLVVLVIFCEGMAAGWVAHYILGKNLLGKKDSDKPQQPNEKK